jgi:mannosyltransferase OCH1-like enzyme
MQQNNRINSNRRIPRLIHQTWKNNTIPLKWNETTQSVRQLNADHFEYRMWTDEDMHAFFRQEEPHLYQTTFLTYPFDIQRVDAFRYVLLHRLGGIYIDMDDGCRMSFETVLEIIEMLDPQSSHLAGFPLTDPFGVSNGFMFSTKGHPLFAQLISHLPFSNRNYLVNYLTVLLSAGPLYLTMREHLFDRFSEKASVLVIDQWVHRNIFTWHTTGNSWHGRDAAVIHYFYRNWRTILSILFTFLFVLICLSKFIRVHRKRTWKNIKPL